MLEKFFWKEKLQILLAWQKQFVHFTDLIIHWIELSHLSKLKPFSACVILLPGPQSHEINMAVVLKK